MERLGLGGTLLGPCQVSLIHCGVATADFSTCVVAWMDDGWVHEWMDAWMDG